MKKYSVMWRVLALVVAFLAAVSLTVAPALADNDDDAYVIEFAETAIFFEFNSTDLDLGIHIFFDAVGWEEVEVTGPDGAIFEVENDGSLNEIGSTEVFTESAEPPLVEDPDTATDQDIADAIADFLARFPEGEYLFEGETVNGYTLRGTAELTHDLPAAPGLVFPDPEEEENEAAPDNTVIEWCDTSEPGDPEIVRYEVVVEFEEDETERVFTYTVQVPADPGAACSFSTQSMPVSEAWFESLDGLDGEFKAEVVAIAGDRNATISENEFDLE